MALEVKRSENTQDWTGAPDRNSNLFAKEYDRAMNKTLYERGDISKAEYYKALGYELPEEDKESTKVSDGVEGLLAALGISGPDIEVAKKNLIKLLVPDSSDTADTAETKEDTKATMDAKEDTTEVMTAEEELEVANKIESLVEEVLLPKSKKPKLDFSIPESTKPTVNVSENPDVPIYVPVDDVADEETLSILSQLIDDELSRL